MESSRREQLDAWANDLQSEMRRVEGELGPLLARKEDLRARLELIQRLSELESKDGREGDRAEGLTRSVPATAGSALEAAAREILEATGRPMHVSEIRAALRDRGVPIPGRGTDANVILYLRRARDVFDRPARGTYGLTAWRSGRKQKDA